MPRKAKTVPRTPTARRLLISRLALGFTEQRSFADSIGMSHSGYNEWETGAKSLSFRGARLISAKHPLPIEWLTDGVPDRLPHGLALKIQALEPQIPQPRCR